MQEDLESACRSFDCGGGQVSLKENMTSVSLALWVYCSGQV